MCTALADEVGRSSRIACCADLAAAMTKLGQVLWVGGFIIGRDRVSGTSPFKFGSDSTVGLATFSQVGGQLLTGVNVLLRDRAKGTAARSTMNGVLSAQGPSS
jgi:hypothetical protein